MKSWYFLIEKSGPKKYAPGNIAKERNSKKDGISRSAANFWPAERSSKSNVPSYRSMLVPGRV